MAAWGSALVMVGARRGGFAGGLVAMLGRTLAVRAAMGRHDLHVARRWVDRTLDRRGWLREGCRLRRVRGVVPGERLAVLDGRLRRHAAAIARQSERHQRDVPEARSRWIRAQPGRSSMLTLGLMPGAPHNLLRRLRQGRHSRRTCRQCRELPRSAEACLQARHRLRSRHRHAHVLRATDPPLHAARSRRLPRRRGRQLPSAANRSLPVASAHARRARRRRRGRPAGPGQKIPIGGRLF